MAQVFAQKIIIIKYIENGRKLLAALTGLKRGCNLADRDILKIDSIC